jgi:hypothetical protein
MHRYDWIFDMFDTFDTFDTTYLYCCDDLALSLAYSVLV